MHRPRVIATRRGNSRWPGRLVVGRGTPERNKRMHRSVVIAAVLALVAGVASAQSQNPPAKSEPNNPAVNTTGTNNANNPVKGANSFTEGQAKSRIEESG